MDIRYNKIETRAVMPNGKIVTSYRSFPRGVTQETYRDIHNKLFKAFGKGAKTTGTMTVVTSS